MQTDKLKNIKDKIDKRFNQLCLEDYVDAGNELKIFYDYLLSVQFLRSKLEKLNAKADAYLEKINSSDSIDFNPKTEFEKQYMSLALIKKCCECQFTYPQWRIVEKISNKPRKMQTDKATEYFHTKFVYTVVEYLKESVDESNNILELLLKYKQKCEWFRKKRLEQLITKNSRVAENLLTSDLFEYLFDNGVQLFIEPKSASGRPDFISTQTSDYRLVAEAKIFNPNNGQDKSYIAKGFSQLYRYMQDYNETLGYLIVFKTCEEDINFSLTDIVNRIPCLIFNHKILYVIVVDIYVYKNTASMRGKIKCYDLDENFIINQITT